MCRLNGMEGVASMHTYGIQQYYGPHGVKGSRETEEKKERQLYLGRSGVK